MSFDEVTRMFEIREDDLSGEQTRELLALHLAGMRAQSPPGCVHALDLSGLTAPDVTVWTAWHQGRVAGIGALKMLSADTAEVKSMRTRPDFIRKGVGTAILETIIGTAKNRGLRRLSLETGCGAAFDPALTLYRRYGFRSGEAFGLYTPGSFNQFLHLDLDQAADS
ncbi:GNAT family N-acetyltransferase [Acetobacter musti]|nr:GNAT family N-acetyltransferase [Acetobacter musti]